MRKLIFLFSLLSFFIASIVFAADSKEQVVNKIFELTGIKGMIFRDCTHMREIYSQGKDQLGENKIKKLTKVMEKAYQPDKIYGNAVKFFLINYDENKYTDIIKLLNSPLEIKISKMEQDALAPQNKEKLDKFHQDLDLTGKIRIY